MCRCATCSSFRPSLDWRPRSAKPRHVQRRRGRRQSQEVSRARRRICSPASISSRTNRSKCCSTRRCATTPGPSGISTVPQGLELTPDDKRVQLAAMLRARAARARIVPTSFAQQRLWFLSRLEPDSAAYNVPSALRLRGPLNEAALRATFNAILARHEVLRGSFALVESEPVQVIAPRVDVALPVVDLTGWPAAAREAEVTRRLRAEAQAPFDLTQAPLLRVSLVRLAPEEHVLLLTLHHIVSDGWSMGILLREIGAMYQATVAGRAVALPALPIQYADFARWQRGWLQGAVLDEQVGYWRGQLAGAPGVLDLPVARPRPAMQTMHGALVGRTLSPQVSRAVSDLSAREGVTVF